MAIKIFISYFTADTNKKLALKKAIGKRTELEAIVVEDYRKNGIDFTEKVMKDLKQSDYFVPILTSKSYQKSQWLNQEIGFARAILEKDKICPIVQKNVIKNLRGFIHSQAEISYNFESSTDAVKERRSFRKCIYALLDDIEEKEKLNTASGLKYQSITKTDYGHTPIVLNILTNKYLTFKIKVKLSSLEQTFRFYYQILTNKGENFWIGYTDDIIQNGIYINEGEISEQVDYNKDLNYNIEINVKNDIEKKFSLIQNSKFAMKGIPQTIVAISFRGDKKIHDPIHYYFAYEGDTLN